MCKWGTSKLVKVFIPADLAHSGKAYWKTVDVDECIAPIVEALQKAGINMRASCCGHSKTMGCIALADGREIVITPDFKTARWIDSMFPPINL